MSSSIQIIANGKAKEMLDPEARDSFLRLVEKVIPGARVDFFGGGKGIAEMVQGGREQGVTVVAAAGGDGTINAVASVLCQLESVRGASQQFALQHDTLQQDTPLEAAQQQGLPALGVLPMGTLNHFAKDLGIPDTVEDALAVLASGSPMQVDVGAVGDRIFLNNSGLGLYPDMVFNRERRQRDGASKWPSVIVESLRALLRYRRLHINVQVDGETLTRRTPVVFVGNNEYSLRGTLASERTSLRDGTLCLYMPCPRGRLGLLWFSARAFFGNPTGDNNFDMILAQEFTISSSRKELRVSIDGEVTTLPTPLHYTIRPLSLSVMVPAAVAQHARGVA